MNRAPITRRGLVAVGAAAMSVGVVGISASAVASPADPDAALLALIAGHGEALAGQAPLSARCRAIHARWEAALPERPAALWWRWSDIEHAVGPASGHGDARTRRDRRGFYQACDVERLREGPPLTTRYSADSETAEVVIPDPIGEARRWEIVAAYDRWVAERTALADRCGLTAANAASDSASEAIADIEATILDVVPTTLAGFRVKARWAADAVPEEWAEILLRDLCGGVAS